MKKITSIFIILILSKLGFTQESYPNLDTIIYFNTNSGSTEYVWGSEHATDQINLANDTNIYRHTFRQHLLVDIYYGLYEVRNDTLFLECNKNCNNEYNRLLLGPIVVPMHDNFFSDTLMISRADGSTDNLSGNLIKLPQKDSIVLYDGNTTYTEVVEVPANYYRIILDYQFKTYDNKENKRKVGIIEYNSLLLDNKRYKRYDWEPYVKPTNKKAKKKRKKK